MLRKQDQFYLNIAPEPQIKDYKHQKMNSVHNATSHVRGEIRSIHHLRVVYIILEVWSILSTRNDQETVASVSTFLHFTLTLKSIRVSK